MYKLRAHIQFAAMLLVLLLVLCCSSLCVLGQTISVQDVIISDDILTSPEYSRQLQNSDTPGITVIRYNSATITGAYANGAIDSASVDGFFYIGLSFGVEVTLPPSRSADVDIIVSAIINGTTYLQFADDSMFLSGDTYLAYNFGSQFYRSESSGNGWRVQFKVYAQLNDYSTADDDDDHDTKYSHYIYLGEAPTATPVPTSTSTPVPTNTPTITPSPTATVTPTPLPTATNSPTPTATNTPVPPTNTPIVPPTYTPQPNTPIPTETATPTNTPIPTRTTTPTWTPTPVPTVTPTLTPTRTPTQVPAAPTYTPVPTVTVTPTYTPTLTPTRTQTPIPTVTQTPTPTPNPGYANPPPIGYTVSYVYNGSSWDAWVFWGGPDGYYGAPTYNCTYQTFWYRLYKGTLVDSITSNPCDYNHKTGPYIINESEFFSPGLLIYGQTLDSSSLNDSYVVAQSVALGVPTITPTPTSTPTLTPTPTGTPVATPTALPTSTPTPTIIAGLLRIDVLGAKAYVITDASHP